MSIERQHGEIIFECDECGDTLDTFTKRFDDALAVLNDAGWMAVKVDDHYEHVCDKCSDERTD